MRQGRLSPADLPLPRDHHRRGALAVDLGRLVQRAAQDPGGAAGARGLHPGHDRPAEAAADHPVPLPALRLQAHRHKGHRGPALPHLQGEGLPGRGRGAAGHRPRGRGRHARRDQPAGPVHELFAEPHHRLCRAGRAGHGRGRGALRLCGRAGRGRRGPGPDCDRRAHARGPRARGLCAGDDAPPAQRAHRLRGLRKPARRQRRGRRPLCGGGGGLRRGARAARHGPVRARGAGDALGQPAPDAAGDGRGARLPPGL